MVPKRSTQAQIDRIAEEAIGYSEPDRKQFLQRRCRGDSELLRRVEALLSLDPDGVSFIDGPFVNLGQKDGDATGRFIGPYRIIRELGRGGMGRVMLGRQSEPFQRVAAIKLLPGGILEADRIRFQAEQNFLAALNHSHICKIYESGETETGLPYFAMEYVGGPDLTSFCDQNRLGLNARLELFDKVAGAVSYAHQKGVIHCDLKPSNILIAVENGVAVPKIIDFGISKIVNPKSSSAYSPFFQGSLGYLSPEQMAGLNRHQKPVVPDTRTDTYALGVILYEMLVGRKPILWDSKASFLSKCATIASRQPTPLSAAWRAMPPNLSATLAAFRQVKPTSWHRLMSGELEWVTAKALEKNPDSRYASPLELQRDLRAYLEGKPVLVGSPSLSYRLFKFAKRQRTALTIGVLLMVLAVGIPTAGWWGKTAEQKITATERDRAEAARQQSEQVTQFLVDLFRSGDPYNDPGQRRTPAQMVEKADRLLAEDGFQDPAVRAELLNALGQVQLSLGRHEKAGFSLEQAVAYRREVLGAMHPKTIETRHHVAHQTMAVGDYSKAAEATVEVIDCRRILFGDQSEEVIESQKLLVSIFNRQGRYEEAAETLRTIALASEARFGLWHRNTASAFNDLGIIITILRRFDEGLFYLERALEIYDRLGLIDYAPRAICIANIGLNYEFEGDYHTALYFYTHAKQLVISSLGGVDYNAAVICNSLARTQGALGNMAEAEAQLNQALRIGEIALGSDHPELATFLNDASIFYRRQQRFDEALAALRRSQSIFEKRLQPDHPKIFLNLGNQGAILVEQNEYMAAIPMLKKTIEYWHSRGEPRHVRLFVPMFKLAKAYGEIGRWDDATRVIEEALSIGRERLPSDHPKIGLAYLVKAKIDMSTGRADEARSSARRAETIFRNRFGPDHVRFREARKFLEEHHKEVLSVH